MSVVSEHSFLPELWSMEPRIFALETSSTGKRKYLVCNLGRFLHYYWRDCYPLGRHYYELIREGTPCRLYFDLEFSKIANPQITSEESEVLMTQFIQELCSEFLLVHGIQITRSRIVDLDASTDKKFSRHLIIHIPNGQLFADAYTAGVFAKRFVGRLADEVATGVLVERHQTLAKHLFVNSQAPKASNSQSSQSGEEADGLNSKKACFVDLGVYTRNRLFRLIGSFKCGKSASSALRIADANEFPFPNGFDNSKFYLRNHRPTNIRSSDSNDSHKTDQTCEDKSHLSREDHDAFCASLDWEMHARALALTFVVPANASKVDAPILIEPTEGSQDHHNKPSVSSITRRPKSSSRSCNGDSPIEDLDKFILELSTRGGVQGKVRSWSIECVSKERKPESYFMSYQMSGNRWCENIGRAHKSNNIIWNVDFASRTYLQTCFDPECIASNFRGQTMHLPEDVAMAVNEYVLDQEIAQIDENEILNDARHVLETCDDQTFGDSELDKALGYIDMSQFTPRSSSK